MCGRYSFVPSKEQIESDLFGLDLPAQLQISFNIAPTHRAYVIANDRPHRVQQMLWGLVPHWSSDGKPSGKLINARAESIAERPAFRDPIRRRRCIVPADSFYEWRNEGGKKVPYRILDASGHLLMMAGIWDEWGSGPALVRTFSVITTTPNLEVSALHNRMPLLLPDAAARERWLAPVPLEEIQTFLHLRAPDGILSMYRVSEKLNYPSIDLPELHAPVEPPPTLF